MDSTAHFVVTARFKNHTDMELAYHALTNQAFGRASVDVQETPANIANEIGDPYPSPQKVEAHANAPIFSPMITTAEKGWFLGLGSSLVMLVFIVIAFAITGLDMAMTQAYLIIFTVGPLGALLGFLLSQTIKRLFDKAEQKQFQLGGKVMRVSAANQTDVETAKNIMAAHNAYHIKVQSH